MIFISLGRFRGKPTKERAPDEKTVMKANMKVNGIVSTETMVAVTREEAHRLIN